MSDVTRLLNAIDTGEPKAADQLLPLVYEELRKLESGNRVLVMSGLVENSRPGALAELEQVHFLDKSFATEDLLFALHRLLYDDDLAHLKEC